MKLVMVGICNLKKVGIHEIVRSMAGGLAWLTMGGIFFWWMC